MEESKFREKILVHDGSKDSGIENNAQVCIYPKHFPHPEELTSRISSRGRGNSMSLQNYIGIEHGVTKLGA